MENREFENEILKNKTKNINKYPQLKGTFNTLEQSFKFSI